MSHGAFRISLAGPRERVSPAGVTRLARALEITAADARLLVQTVEVLPFDCTEAEANALAESLRASGLDARPVPLASSGEGRCAAHVRLSPAVACLDCRTSICAICSTRGQGRCLPCAERQRQKKRFERGRIIALLLVLATVALWAVVHHRRLAARANWARTLEVNVTLLASSDLSSDAISSWSAQLVRLDAKLEQERLRYGGVIRPFHFTLHGPVKVSQAPVFEPESDGLISRASHAWRLSRELSELDVRSGVHAADADVRLYVWLEPLVETTPGIVEGSAAAGGNIGLVRTPFPSMGMDPDADFALPLIAVAHELLHCFGATDKYDAAGHTRDRAALPEPDKQPPFPQRFAEVMVGELSLAPARGRVPHSLEELRVGPETAGEIHWADR